MPSGKLLPNSKYSAVMMDQVIKMAQKGRIFLLPQMQLKIKQRIASIGIHHTNRVQTIKLSCGSNANVV